MLVDREAVERDNAALAEKIEEWNNLSNGKQSGPRIGIQKGPLTDVGTGLSR
ncbi:MAG TPA: hypothetical protein VF383_13310 [Candidatus Dormibacteraeota bacterium]